MVAGSQQFHIIPDRQPTGLSCADKTTWSDAQICTRNSLFFFPFSPAAHAHIRMASGSSLVTALHPPSFRHHQLGPTRVPLVIFSSPARLLLVLFPVVPFLVPENTSRSLKKEWFGQDAKGESCAPGKFY
jgi:hypothetical protein